MVLVQKELKNAYIWEYVMPAWIYHNATLWLISLSSDGSSWITIADKNLWATQVYNDGDTLSQANCGKYYQWWNNYGFPRTWTITTSTAQVNASTYWPWNYYNSSTFIVRTKSPLGWDSSSNHNLWGNTTDTNEARRWPCDSWYHIPKASEVTDLLNIRTALWFWTGTGGGTDFSNYLKIPFSWNRNGTVAGGGTAWQWTHWRLWTSSTWYDDGRATCLYFVANTIFLDNTEVRCFGIPIRPFPNTPTQPNDTRTVLYQPS